MTVIHSKASNTSLQLLLHEIEATPTEYWADLLETLRKFRQTIPPTINPIINIEQAQKNQPATDLLDSCLGEDEDANEHQQA